MPPKGGKKKRYVFKAILMSRLELWQSGDLLSLWKDARLDANCSLSQRHGNNSTTQNVRNRKRALVLAREGRYRNAMRSLSSLGTASPDDSDVLSQLQQCHPQHILPDFIDDIPPPLSVDSESVLAALRAFPRASSPGAS